MYTPQELAQSIKTCSKNKNITIKKMLSDLGLGVNVIGNLNSGRSMAFDSLAKIADYLGCSVDYLLGRTDDPKGYASPEQLDSELDELYRYIKSLPEEEQQRLTTLLWNILETIKTEASE